MVSRDHVPFRHALNLDPLMRLFNRLRDTTHGNIQYLSRTLYLSLSLSLSLSLKMRDGSRRVITELLSVSCFANTQQNAPTPAAENHLLFVCLGGRSFRILSVSDVLESWLW